MKRRFGSKHWHVWVVWLVCITLVIGVVAALGGFKDRTDQRTSLDPGQWVSLNHCEIRVVEAVAKEATDYWSLRILIEVRNTSEQPLKLYSIEKAIALGYTNTEGEFLSMSSPQITTFLADGSVSPRDVLPPLDTVVRAMISKNVKGLSVDENVRIGLFPMEYRDSTVLGISDAKAWYPDSGAPQWWMVDLPIRVET